MIRPYRDYAATLLASGFNPIPIVPRTKRPALRGWQTYCSVPMPAELVQRYVDAPRPFGIGLALGFRGLVAIDVDTDNAALLAKIREVLA